MNTLKLVIEALAKNAELAAKPQDAMQFSQAALNLAHVIALLDSLKNR